MRERLAAYYDEFSLGAVPEPSDPLPRFDEERVQLLLDLRPPVVSFHFGLPPANAMRRIKQSGVIVISSATTVAEARKLEAEGADAIIAQGLEAGGHRGTFSNWQATEVGLQVNFGRETAARAAKRLIMLPPFASAAEGIQHLHQMRRLAHRRQGIKERFESSRSAQPPEPLPHAVPVPEFLREEPAK